MKKNQNTIAIDGSRAFLKRRTGIEEYAYRVILHLRDELKQTPVILYIRADQKVDFPLPENWRVKKLWAPRLWTQGRLSFEMLVHPPSVLFVPAHTVPIIHPKNTVVVIHGLEYEFCPKSYSRWGRVFMRAAIRFSCRVAKTVVCVSENTKRDVMRLYGTPEEKIRVVYEGYAISDHQGKAESWKRPSEEVFFSEPYFLFIGRLEERKNIVRLIRAFEMVKEQYCLPHRLVLAGKPGFGYGAIRAAIDASDWKGDILELGYVSAEEKAALLHGADVFFFVTLYEGFGIPVLEAQSAGIPVLTSNLSSLPEVAGEGAILVDPEDTKAIAEALWTLVSDKERRNAIIRKGLENVKRFSWGKCARELAVILQREEK